MTCAVIHQKNSLSFVIVAITFLLLSSFNCGLDLSTLLSLAKYFKIQLTRWKIQL